MLHSRVLRALGVVAFSLLAVVGSLHPAQAEPPNPFAIAPSTSSPVLRPVGPAPAEQRVDTVLARLLVASDQGLPGASLPVALELQHDAGWHTYWKNPGDSGLPTLTSYRLRASTGEVLELSASEIRWPTPSRFPVGPLSNYGYADRVLLAQDLRLPADLPPAFLSPETRLELQAEWLVCKDVCIPGSTTLSQPLDLQSTLPAAPAAPPAWLGEVARSLPVEGPSALKAGLSADRSQILVWSADARPLEALRASLGGGTLMVDVEGLVVPSAAQPLQQIEGGWRMELPLGPRAPRQLPSVESMGELRGVWRQEASSDQPGQSWRAVWVADAAQVPPRVGDLAPGLTAEQAYRAAKASGSSPSSDASVVQTSLLAAAGLALVGGLLLNLMPCVFPVLGLKALSLAGLESAAGARRQAFFFAVGVIASMLALAGLLLGLRAAGEAVGWGFQLQSPWVVAGLVLLFTAIGINLLGAFEWGTSATRLGNLESGEPHGPRSALLSGLLTVIVATPCTAPFMGAALGYAVAAGTLQAITVFLFLAIGLALPTVLLTLSPGLRGRLPRPGPWMETLKQFLAFPMFATVAWLAWVFATQQGATALLWLLLAMVGLGLGFWAYGLRQRSSKNGIGSLLALVVGFALALGFAGLGAGQAGVPKGAGPSAASAAQAGELPWQAWEPGLPERLAREGKVVLVDFTATWCITCQANKIRVLQVEPVRSALMAPEVVILKADWTRQDPRITEELNRFGRTGVPLNVVYSPAGREPEVLSEWLTTEGVLAALAKARQ